MIIINSNILRNIILTIDSVDIMLQITQSNASCYSSIGIRQFLTFISWKAWFRAGYGYIFDRFKQVMFKGILVGRVDLQAFWDFNISWQWQGLLGQYIRGQAHFIPPARLLFLDYKTPFKFHRVLYWPSNPCQFLIMWNSKIDPP